MVLTQRYIPEFGNYLVSVSIPLWFLRNRLSSRYCFTRRIVSIPLWFLRNARRHRSPVPPIYCFHTTMVLTQHKPIRPLLSDHAVSIPLWFLRNCSPKQLTIGSITCFHTTMVLTQLHTRSFHSLPHLRFPYHYGSYATEAREKRIRKSIMFPYHYGSYATHLSHQIPAT